MMFCLVNKLMQTHMLFHRIPPYADYTFLIQFCWSSNRNYYVKSANLHMQIDLAYFTFLYAKAWFNNFNKIKMMCILKIVSEKIMFYFINL